jgi:outer membrane protein assembly factor BamD (BamD/ComL family)
MGRLPAITYKQMVDNCREIIRRWPGSEYAFYAKRALADLSDRYKKMYNITDEETDLGDFK